MRLRACGLGVVMMTLATAATGQPLPVVPGHLVEVYATATKPAGISIAPDGTIFLGRQAEPGQPEGSFRITRIDTSRVSAPFGGLIYDPDAVLFDANGAATGQAGSVLVGTFEANNQGGLFVNRANGTTERLAGPTTAFLNPIQFVADSQGRALFSDFNGQQVVRFTPGGTSVVAQLTAGAWGITFGDLGRLYVAGVDGVIRRYNSDGTLNNASLTPGLGTRGSLAYATGTQLNEGVLALAGTELWRINAANGEPTVIGTGFTFPNCYTSMSVGPDGALYVPDCNNDRVLKISCGEFTRHPTDIRMCYGGDIELTVAVNVPPDAGAPIYTWRQNGQNVNSSLNPTLRIITVGAREAGEWDCVVTTNCGRIVSRKATLFFCRADWNCDDAVDFNDYLAFLNDFNAQLVTADLNSDEAIDFNDFLEFLNLYNAGC